MPPKKKCLSIKEKMEIINASEKQNLSVRSLAKRFNIGKTQAAVIVKQKKEIKHKWQTGDVWQKKTFLKPDGLKVDTLCYEWLSKARSQNIPISGPLIQEKAREIAERLSISNFTASCGWLQKWRKRHNVSFKNVCGEAAAVDPKDVQEFIEKLPTLLLGYNPADIYNINDTCLFFRAMPNKTEKCTGGKLSKERLTVLLCVNMIGEKEKPLVIGKAARPRAFKTVDINNLPVDWESNKKSWMTREILTKWLKELDRKIGLQKRKVILFLNNATSDERHLQLNNIKLMFLPANTACQPLDQGIIQSFKCQYVQHMAQSGDDPTHTASNNFNVLDAINYIKASWEKVSPETIKNCFAKAGFKKAQSEILFDFDTVDDTPLSTLAGCSKMVDKTEKLPDVDDFLIVDDGVCTADDNIVIKDEIEEISDIEMENVQEYICDEDNIHITSYSEALKCVRSIKKFLNDDIVGYEHAHMLERHLEHCFVKQAETRMRQTTINNYFLKYE